MAADEARAAQKAGWDSAAGAWQRHAGLIDKHARHVTGRMLEAAAPLPGERVLELACGPGGVGTAAAARMGTGEVVVSDFSEAMVAAAAERAAEATGAKVTARVLDMEAIDEPDASFDVVLCRMGLMLVPDPARACAEIARVLRPGGRAAVAVWGAREHNPWLAILLDAVGQEFGIEMPPPGVRGPFSLGDPAELTAALAGGGLREIEVAEVQAPFMASSVQEWWSVVPELGGALAALLAAQPEEVRASIRERAVAALAAVVKPTGIPGLALVASARV